MKGFIEEKGACARLVYDQDARAFVLRPIAHPFAPDPAARLEAFNAEEPEYNEIRQLAAE